MWLGTGSRSWARALRHALEVNPQSNERGSNEEIVLSQIGQVGTQFDGFADQNHRKHSLSLLQDR